MRIHLFGLTALMLVGCPAPDAGCQDEPTLCGLGTVCDPIANRCVVAGDMTSEALDMASADMPPMDWIPQPSGTTNNLNGIWGTDANNIWVVGDSGTLLKWNGAAWTAQTSGTVSKLYDVWGSDANNFWAVGLAGTIL